MSQTYGKTRWKRFALVMVPSIAATAVVGVSIAQSALAASFSVSGQQFKVTADTLHGTNFAQFGSVDVGSDKSPHVVAISAFDKASIHNLCQSVVYNLGPLGTYTLQLHAGTDPVSGDISTDARQVQASNLLIDLNQLKADATFQNIDIGRDASTLSGSATNGWKAADGSGLPSGATGFAQSAQTADLSGVQQTAWATSAGTFALPGLNLNIVSGDKECY
ncbi:DUF6230 family protein [Kitasatospora sp. GAS204B]|uniref:DUF6230 family protein n=1 Tax=unclassified Kitasatospora TaxID=2633591 RepID=UPI002473A5AE|nr:DUF6230 family protein [Kitasatospora sp. GAS204B]MDH6116305.1 hypothetical protein [Kitasatospora sp. GAS204B]